MTDQLVETTLVKKHAFTGRLGRDLAKETTKGTDNGDLALGPDPPVAGDQQGADNLAVEQFNRLDQDAPFGTRNGPGEGPQRLATTELVLNSLTDQFKLVGGVLADDRVDVETRNWPVRTGDHRHDLGPGRDVVERLDNESSLVAHFQSV